MRKPELEDLLIKEDFLRENTEYAAARDEEKTGGGKENNRMVLHCQGSLSPYGEGKVPEGISKSPE